MYYIMIHDDISLQEFGSYNDIKTQKNDAVTIS